MFHWKDGEQVNFGDFYSFWVIIRILEFIVTKETANFAPHLERNIE